MDVPAGADASSVGVGQWVPGLTFGEFAERTVGNYYKTLRVPPASASAGAGAATAGLLVEQAA